MNEIFDRFRGARIFDLAQSLYPGVPHFPTHAPFLYSLSKLHGEFLNQGGGSSASEAITMGAHTGTHIDALCHFSCCGKLFGDVEPRQSTTTGVEPYSIDTMQPILRRGVLFDIAAQQKVDVLPHDFVITPEHLADIGADLHEGDVAIIRTGWARYWDNPHQFVTAGLGAQVTCPGPQRAGAEWLSAHKVFAVSSDTLAFEFMPSPAMEVHVHLLVERGIHIIENLNLDELAAAGMKEFLFVASPLKIRGGTGSPIRPLGVVF